MASDSPTLLAALLRAADRHVELYAHLASKGFMNAAREVMAEGAALRAAHARLQRMMAQLAEGKDWWRSFALRNFEHVNGGPLEPTP